MGPEALAQVLRPLAGFLPPERSSDLLVGLAEGDDAAVFRLDEGKALVFTVDFFTPIVDDPYDFGAIAAANALSDVYATGGEPFLALNIAAFPADLDVDTMATIIRGAAEKAAEAGCVVAGGHTVVDAEPKFGLAVIGLAHPSRLFLKSSARPGDAIVLTKPLGTGAITTWAKAGKADGASLAAAVASMKRLNREASSVFLESGVRACTDVTGFSLLGHASEMAEKSGVRLSLRTSSIPFIEGAMAACLGGFLPGGAGRNRKYFSPRIEVGSDVDEAAMSLLFSPETSGGLLAAVEAGMLEECLARLSARGIDAALIGRVESAAGDSDESWPDGKAPLIRLNRG